MAPSNPDIEASRTTHDSVLEWTDLQVEVRDKKILGGISGRIHSGEMLAVLGPSGAGKSTFLDVLAQRVPSSAGQVHFNGDASPDMRRLSSYVEQHDALLGVLTVRETLLFAAKLSFPSSTPSALIHSRVDETIAELGLARVAHHRIGTPIQRGISGGQRRRVTLGCELVRLPRVLLVDEPTSGLDSTASREVVEALRRVSRRYGTLIIATIHQPSYETLSLFDRALLIAHGRTAYSGRTVSLLSYFRDNLNHPFPPYSNPAEQALDLLSDEFNEAASEVEAWVDESDDKRSIAAKRVESMLAAWADFAVDHPLGFDDAGARSVTSPSPSPPFHDKFASDGPAHSRSALVDTTTSQREWYRPFHQTGILIHRTFLNYTRNLLAYGVRVGMYIGMGVLLATVWVNLGTAAVKINDRLSVHFFSVAFLGFMSVAGIPAFLEERHVYMRERMNGLYGPGPYVLANSLCSAPFLFACSLIFSLICYWSIGLHPGAGHFFRFLAVLFLAVYTAESQSLVVAAAIPIFVAALAIASFLNGFWMCVQGYFIRAVNLPTFWRVWAHWIDYQTFAFNVLVNNDFRGMVFRCAEVAGQCHCEYPSSLVAVGQCELAGEDVLQALDIAGIDTNLYVGILFCIALVYRLLFFVVLMFQKR
ncbi:P-loop containing nucleoside triphosphate hydrolase protein [Auricularia subglabra TFB-10046 SS5]|nr:P-loop containing nucleoside triphosphate hydrolase protein [Auricularia subglabra TFB-10046 SS5]